MKQLSSAAIVASVLMAVPVITVGLTISPVQAGDSCAAPCAKLPTGTRAVSLVGLPRPPAPAVLLTATLKNAKPKRVLEVSAVMTTSQYTPGMPSTLQLWADVNGIALQPSAAGTGMIVDCGGGAGVPLGPPSYACTVNGSWWLDLDDPANVALLTKPLPPLTVTLSGGELFPLSVFAPIDVSMVVRLVKK